MSHLPDFSTSPFLSQKLMEYASHIFKFLTSQIRVSENGRHKKTSLTQAAVAPETLLPHQEFRNSLKGQEVFVPSLYSLFPEWSPKLHQGYERARDEVINPWLESRWVDNSQTCMKLKAANFTILAAILCVDTSFDKLCTVAKSFAWYFIWDDPYLKKCKEYFQYHLLEIGEHPDLSRCSQEQQNALLCWNEVGQHLRESCSRSVCEVFLDKMLGYVASVDTVDSIFHKGMVPSLAEYWQRRDLTAGVYPVLATLPFIYGIDISMEHLKNPAFAALLRQTSYVVHITNDMLSMRKEAVKRQPNRDLIPVIMLNYELDCDRAMQTSFQMAKDEVKGIVLWKACSNREAKENTSEIPEILATSFIKGCKDVAMGLIHWSYSGERYFKQQEFCDDKSVTFRI
ncbi:hypothetical protein MGYG_05127 [Nannizzia gypsea CBS 118893]|uniref:Terpene synthase n=1 Tax=Arthroderma gypseum (strain ATCC MYA-4604 / CBS 118893) TaxID=535722 RepID=E4UYG2_ARTGP|nr:hypothetical protein MGYG_05127 [Nannizzia gypsea CBS 118893]EFR02125.1 hypothetical protein MGYG_05127 [Nannizzia gypsea CBS 118893]